MKNEIFYAKIRTNGGRDFNKLLYVMHIIENVYGYFDNLLCACRYCSRAYVYYFLCFQNKKELVYADLCHPDIRPSAPLAAATYPVIYAHSEFLPITSLVAATHPVIYADLKVSSSTQYIHHIALQNWIF